MKNTIQSDRKISTIITLISIVILAPWLVSCAYLTPLPDSLQEQVNDATEDYYNLDGIIVYVDKKGQKPKLFSAGWKNRENKVQADPQSLFKIASISKLYVAVAVAKLVNGKRLSLDKTLVDYLPELAGRIEYADKITLKLLVQHRSGIPNFTDHPGYWENITKSTKESLDLVLDKPADFTPDDEYSYSNTNFLLLGDILDKTLGYSHHKYIKREILIPLELHNTYSLMSEVDLDRVISGYYVGNPNDLKLVDFIDPSGSMVATASDVGVFLRALNDGSLLNSNEQAIYSSIYVYEHTGLLPGYSSISRYHKDIDAVVVQFVNTGGGNSWLMSEIIYKRIIRILRDQ